VSLRSIVARHDLKEDRLEVRMMAFYSIASFLFTLALVGSLNAADVRHVDRFDEMRSGRSGAAVAGSWDTALIGGPAGGWDGSGDVFCVTLTPEQIGFVINTVEVLAIDGAPIKGHASALITKLEVARSKLNPETITAVFNQLEDFISKVNYLTQDGNLPAAQGELMIDSILGLVCRA